MEVDTCGPMDDFEDLFYLIYVSESNLHRISMNEVLVRVSMVEQRYRERR